MFAACMSLCKGEFKRRIRTLTVTGALVVTGTAIVLVAIGFGLSLLYVWLQQLYGTMPALGIIAGGCGGVALILFLIAFFRPVSRPRPVHREAGGSERMIAGGEQAIEEAIEAVQHGSRETMLATLSLALAAGVVLGRKL